MSKGIKRKVSKTIKIVNAKITAGIDRGNRFSAAFAREGYNGGYVDALNDVLLVLNGVKPNRNLWWDEAFKDEDK